MLLHGSPGSGKSTLIKRVRAFTNLPIKITATSGVAAMSLQGVIIDYLMGRGYGNSANGNLQKLEKRLGSASLLIIDEISMTGCKKLLQLDLQLQKWKNNNNPFGGLDVIFVGNYAQLPPVRQEPVMDTLI